jgi:hypothetical protein
LLQFPLSIAASASDAQIQMPSSNGLCLTIQRYGHTFHETVTHDGVLLSPALCAEPYRQDTSVSRCPCLGNKHRPPRLGGVFKFNSRRFLEGCAPSDRSQFGNCDQAIPLPRSFLGQSLTFYHSLVDGKMEANFQSRSC